MAALSSASSYNASAILQAQPLPPNPYIDVVQSALYNAYDQCLQAEWAAGSDLKLLMYARCLGYLIHEAPDDEARCHVSEEILLCERDPESMNLLAQFYIDHLFRLFRQNRGRTPSPSRHSSCPYPEDFLSSTVDPAPKEHTAAKNAALRRDNYRCMVTGAVDLYSFKNMTDDQKAAHNLTSVFNIAHTNFCHIFPPSINWDLKPDEHGHPKTRYSGNIWDMVNCFGGINVLNELNGDMAHRSSNGLSMSMELRHYFDDFNMWFEEVPNNLHTYHVCSAFPRLQGLSQLGPNPVVTFATTADLELPDPRYLNSYDRELEERKVLAPDGSSGELLSSQLRRALLVRTA
ncbi:unnamed protein product [Cyclocybe aegerita]|uniref:HNH nuclease domain-containing protein n=1 Tax=Cyclocybe aegerita TaxID=1973307 RepID=A0A8S0WTI0_CYCAE|nr:unnamed protein product [Cyclocybe aegerita]